jgi:transcriptional regulator with XRE-family HTH domain
VTGKVIYLERAAEARRNIPKVVRLLLAVSQRPARELADALEMPHSRLSERLSGKVRISSDELAAYALFFGVEEGVFYRDPESFRRQIIGDAAPAGEPTDRWINWAGQKPSRGQPNLAVPAPTEAKVA